MIREVQNTIPQIEPGVTLRQVAEKFFVLPDRTRREEKTQLKPLRSLLAKGTWVALGYQPGELEPVRVPPELIEVLGVEVRGSRLVGSGHQFLSVRLFPAGTEPDLHPKQRMSKAKHGRPPGRSYEAADAEAVDEMQRRITQGTATSPTNAADQIIDEKKIPIKGAGTRESKISRLVLRHRRKYPEFAGGNIRRGTERPAPFVSLPSQRP